MAHISVQSECLDKLRKLLESGNDSLIIVMSVGGFVVPKQLKDILQDYLRGSVIIEYILLTFRPLHDKKH